MVLQKQHLLLPQHQEEEGAIHIGSEMPKVRQKDEA
jgi:hypothetical protein